MEFIDPVLAFIQSAAAQSAVVGIVLEFVLRLIPSKKPLSVLHMVGACAKKVGQALVAVGDLFDKILPQKIAEPKV